MKQTIRAVVAVTSTNGLLLLLKRFEDDKSYPNKWCIPAGGIKEDESTEDAVKRVLNDHIGLSKPESVVYNNTIVINHEETEYSFEIFYVSFKFPFSLKMPKEFTEIFFAEKEEALAMDLAGPVTRAIVEGYFESTWRENEVIV